MNYPSWQQKVREHQAKYEAQLAAARLEREAEEKAKKLKDVNYFRENMATIGLDLPESDSGEWVIDGFVLKMYPSRVYSRQMDLMVMVNVEVEPPYQFDQQQEYELIESEYQLVVSRLVEVRMNDVLTTAAEIAQAFDELPLKAVKVRERNVAIVSAIAAADADQEEESDLSEPEAVATVPVNSNEALLAEVVGYIREIAQAARKLSEGKHG